MFAVHIVAVAIIWSTDRGEAGRWSDFGAGGHAAMGDFASGFLRPALSTAFLGSLVQPLLETIAIAACGLALAFVLGFPLSMAAADLETLGGGEGRVRGPGRWVMLAVRSLAR